MHQASGLSVGFKAQIDVRVFHLAAPKICLRALQTPMIVSNTTRLTHTHVAFVLVLRVCVRFFFVPQEYEKKQIKMWKTMNDAQHMWIIGSFFKFRCFTALYFCVVCRLICFNSAVSTPQFSMRRVLPERMEVQRTIGAPSLFEFEVLYMTAHKCRLTGHCFCRRHRRRCRRHMISRTRNIFASCCPCCVLGMPRCCRFAITPPPPQENPAPNSYGHAAGVFHTLPRVRSKINSADAGWDDLKGYDMSTGEGNVLTKFVGGDNEIFVVQVSGGSHHFPLPLYAPRPFCDDRNTALAAGNLVSSVFSFSPTWNTISYV